MDPVNEALQSAFIGHSVDLTRVSSYLQWRSRSFLKELEEDIVRRLQDEAATAFTRSKLNTLLAATRRMVKEAYTDIAADHTEHLIAVAQAEPVFLTAAFRAVSGTGLPYAGLTVEQLTALASNTLVNGAPSAEWWAKQSSDLAFRFGNQIRLGYAQGETNSQLVQRIRGKATGRRMPVVAADGTVSYAYTFSGGIMDVTTREAEALVRTSVQQVASEARFATLEANSDILRGMRWVSTLDQRTSPICRARDGRMYTLDGKPIGHTVPFLGGPPAHWNCRSCLVPVTKSLDDILGTKGLDKAYRDRLAQTATRASMDGQVPASTTYQQWFDKQDADTQKDILGPKKLAIYKRGNLSFEDMVDQRGNPLTIAQLTDKL